MAAHRPRFVCKTDDQQRVGPYDPRSFPQIETTLNHMIELLYSKAPWYGGHFAVTVQLFDQIRALQVDLGENSVLAQNSYSRGWHLHHILILYLILRTNHRIM
jgi:hypothetical protein